jgi:hypothetical protein
VQAASPRTTTIDVLNGTDVVRLAARNGDKLISYGFRVNNVDSTDPTPQTTIEYPASEAAQAKALLDFVPHAKIVETSTVRRVTLLLGANGVQAKGLATAHPASKASAPKDRTQGRGCID